MRSPLKRIVKLKIKIALAIRAQKKNRKNNLENDESTLALIKNMITSNNHFTCVTKTTVIYLTNLIARRLKYAIHF